MKLKYMSALMGHNRAALVYAFILNVLLLLPAIMSPIFTQVFTDSILIGGISEWLFPLLAVMASAAMFSSFVTWLQKSCLLRLSNKIELAGTASYIWRIFTAPLSFFHRQNSFVFLSRARTIRISSRILTDILSLFTTLVSVVLYFTMMVRLNLSMSIIALGLILINSGVTWVQSLVIRKISRKDGELSPRALTLRDERLSSMALQNIETFKSTASEPLFFRQMMSSKIRIINAGSREDEEEALEPFSNLPSVFFMNILLLISALRIMNREFTIGSYLAFQAYAAAFFHPMNQALSAPSLLTSLEKRLEDLARELDTGAWHRSDDGRRSWRRARRQPQRLRGFIEIRDVSFRYHPDEAPALEHFSLSLKPGQRAALAGKSGAGKSTVIKLLQGLYIPQEGEILIDGIRPQDLDRELYIHSMGCADQEMQFFSASIRDNITLWDDEVSDQAVYRAAKDVFLHDFISALEGAYEYQLAEKGRNFSGGQQQRIEIARALLYNPSIVLLDEATGALGPAISAGIEANLVRRGCTCLQATHVLANVTGYDEIILLDQGRVLARGSHRKLLAESAQYAELYKRGWVQ
jgi:ABC-type bacteriocin/lantibiotic exporter with double-glycine peptidase domain